jgi:hypothetical protein
VSLIIICASIIKIEIAIVRHIDLIIKLKMKGSRLSRQLFSVFRESNQLTRTICNHSYYINKSKYTNPKKSLYRFNSFADTKLLNQKYGIETNILICGTKQLSSSKINKEYDVEKQITKNYDDMEEQITKNYDDEIKKINNYKDNKIVKYVLDFLNLNGLYQYRKKCALKILIDIPCYIVYGIWATFCIAVGSIMLLLMIGISMEIFAFWIKILNKKK